ncbi:MAG: hypothetical protein JWP71_3072 [Mucilaginibacter sp.]|nr:hypothetical protein [Mucilaginibacter sp.]
MSLTHVKSIKDFWFSRIIRLYPSYWLSIIIAVVSIKLFNDHPLPHNLKFVIGNITMFQPLFHTTNLADVYWTLYVEMSFYIIIFLLWLFNLFKNIELLILIGLVITATINGVYLITGNEYAQYTKFFVITRSIMPLLSHFQFFAAGIIFYICYTKGFNSYRVALLILTICEAAVAHSNSVMINSYLTIYEHVMCNIIFYMVFALIISNKLSFLKAKILIAFGNASYPIYLIHQSFGVSLKAYLNHITGEINSTIIAISCTLLLSFLITYFYDIPIRHWLRHKYLGKT